MDIQTKIISDNLIIEISERIDALEQNGDGQMKAPNVILKEIIDRAFEEQKLIKVIIDLSKTKYIDSMVIGSFIGISKVIKSRDGRIILSGVSADIYSIFENLGLEKLFSFAQNIEDALKMRDPL